MDPVLGILGGIQAGAVLVAGGRKGYRWLLGPDALQWQLRKRSAYLDVADELDRLGQYSRAETQRWNGNLELARWFARVDMRAQWKLRAGLLAVGTEIVLAFVVACVVVALAHDGLREWGIFIAEVALLAGWLVGITLGILEFRFSRAVEDRAKELAVWAVPVRR